jgi:hypothetical protein
VIQAFLDLPAVAQFAILVVVYGGVAALTQAVTQRWPTRTFFERFRGVVAPFMGTVGILFGLLTGFLANDVGARNRDAWDAVITEANALNALHTLSLAAPSDLSPIRDAIRGLIRAEVSDEWPRMREGNGSLVTDAAYRTLLETVARLSGGTAGPTLQSTLLATALRAGDARSRRLALAYDRGDDAKWVSVLILALLTQFTVALVQLERPAPQAAALAVFTVAAVVALGLIALQEQPFAGPLRLAPTPLQDLVEAMGNG